MNDAIVIAVAVGAIAWVNWYFFFADRSAASAVVAEGVQEVGITVKGGDTPAEIHAKEGVPRSHHGHSNRT